MKYKKEDGTEVEVFSQEELDAKLKEEGDKIRTEFDGKMKDKEDAAVKLATDKIELEKKMVDIKPDHPNFAALKEALDKKDTEIKALADRMDGDKKDRENAEMTGFIDAVASKDDELKKKIKYHLDNTVSGMKSATVEERKAKVEAAIKLSIDTSEPGLLDSIIAGGGNRGIVIPNVDGKQANFTEREKQLGLKLGISEEDYKKYAGRVTRKD